MSDFDTQFHGLAGTTVGEKKRSLLQLFRAHPNQTINLTPQNHLERLFYVDALIFYRDFEKLYANYLKNDEITVNKLRNCPWFFRGVLDMPDDFVSKILPKFSFVARQKLITGASKVMTEQEADEIFDALVDRYGLAYGMRIVTRCSKAKVSKITQENEVVLKEPQLKVFHKTYPEIFEKFNQDTDSQIFIEIANQNPDRYVELVKSNKCTRRLGRRSTKNLLKKRKEEVLDNISFYLAHVLNERKFVRMMGENFEKIYEQLLPDNKNQIYYGESWSCLEYYPENKRYLLHMKVVEKKFGSFDTIFATGSFLDLVKDFDLREKLASANYKESQNEDWWKYYKTMECLVKVTEMLNSSSNQRKRVKLAKILAKNCCNNQDYEAFLQVLELLSKRLKNDTEFLTNFFRNLESGKSMDFAKCDESHWKLLTEIVSAPDFENESQSCFIKIHVHYMVFLNETQQSEACNNLVQAFIDKYGLDTMLDYFKFDPNTAGSRFERKFLVSMMGEINWELFERIIDYNKRSPTHRIDIFHISNLQEVLQEAPSRQRYTRKRIFDSFFLDSVFRGKTEQLYWDELSDFGDVKSITWYLTHDLNNFSDHFDTYLHACFETNSRLSSDSLWRKLKCYQHLAAKLLQYLSKHKTPKIFKALAHFVNFEDYVKAFQNLEDFYASSITSADENMKETVIEQKTLKAFRVFVRRVKILNAKPQDLLAFKNRPFVQRIPMILHAFYNMPECEALPFLEEIRTGGVSITKQALFLTCVICERKAIVEELKRNKLTQTVPQALRFFIKNPSDDVFEIVLLRLRKLDQNNSDTTALVTDICNIPRKYQPKYFETLWKVLTETKSKALKSRTISNCRSSTLDAQQVELVFENDFMQSFVRNFTSDFLINNPAKTTEKLEVFFKYLTQFKQEKWHERSAKRDLFDFISIFVKSYASASTNADETLMVQFLERFKATFREAEAFEVFTKIKLMQLKHRSVEESVELVLNLIDYVVDQFSEVCLGLLIATIKEVFAWHGLVGFTNLEFCYRLLKLKKSAYAAILVLKLLPNNEPSGEAELEMYQWVMSTIQTFQDAKVEVYLSLFYKSY